MRIWTLSNPYDKTFAQAAATGTWSPGAGSCPECNASRGFRIPPMILEWEPGSDRVGDFTWSWDSPAITQRVLDSLQTRFRGFEPGPVEMVQPRRLKRPPPGARRQKHRVWLPYEGPPLYELWVTHWVYHDPDQSTVRLEEACGTCDRRFYKVLGAERRYPEMMKPQWEIGIRHEPRLPGHGVYVRAADLGEADIFAIHHVEWYCCTDRVKAFIEGEGFTNLKCLELGEVIPGPPVRGADLVPHRASPEGRRAQESAASRTQAPGGQVEAAPAGPAPLDPVTGLPRPDHPKDFAAIQATFPFLAENSSNGCQVSLNDILRYLALEVPEGDELHPDDLQFVRTARVGEMDFWLWRFEDMDGKEWFVTVGHKPDGTGGTRCDPNRHGLTPEQFILWHYYDYYPGGDDWRTAFPRAI